ncbi:hypothetical protein NitYY0918_C0416 [Nitratiruptor sp. YY09-18]|nr:hypothetical protein NitYY0918_C0416 [Nitratiruptor sp. YY09-18]
MRGANSFKGQTYIDLIAQELQAEAINCGITMSTTREGLILFNKYKSIKPDFVIIAYGLVDSWKTFKYAPYVLYYPDNILRKIARKFVKKYKKIARKLGLNEILGQKYVVPPKEYKKNLQKIIEQAKEVILIETPPHLSQLFRNRDIQLYNTILDELSQENDNCKVVKIYDDFEKNKAFYLDNTHFNQDGYNYIAKKILEVL